MTPKTLYLVYGSPHIAQLLFAGLCSTFTNEQIRYIKPNDTIFYQDQELYYKDLPTNNDLEQIEQAMKDRCQGIIILKPLEQLPLFKLSQEYNYNIITINEA